MPELTVDVIISLDGYVRGRLAGPVGERPTAAARVRPDCDRPPAERGLTTNLFETGDTMATFVTIGYGDQAGYDRTPEPVRNAAHDHDQELVRAGAVMGVAGEPVQVRNPEGAGVETRTGRYLSSELPIAGFAVIEADSLEDAIAKVSPSPCAVAHGVIEVWPLGGQ